MEDVEARDGRTVAVSKAETGEVHSEVLRMSDANLRIDSDSRRNKVGQVEVAQNRFPSYPRVTESAIPGSPLGSSVQLAVLTRAPRLLDL